MAPSLPGLAYLNRRWQARNRRLVWFLATCLGLSFLALEIYLTHLPSPFSSAPAGFVNDSQPFGFDALSYYLAHGGANAYAGTSTTIGLGVWRYAPIWLPFLESLQQLPFFVFVYGVIGAELLSLLYLTRRWFFASFIFVPVFTELYLANITFILAAAIVFALRQRSRRSWGSSAYAALFFTKVTPFVAVGWHLFRGEWRALSVALGTVALVVLAGFLIDPVTWGAWFHSFLGTSSVHDASPLGLPFLARAILSIPVLFIGARRGWPALVILAVFLSLPSIWFPSYSLLIAMPAARDSLPRHSAQDRVSAISDA